MEAPLESPETQDQWKVDSVQDILLQLSHAAVLPAYPHKKSHKSAPSISSLPRYEKLAKQFLPQTHQKPLSTEDQDVEEVMSVGGQEDIQDMELAMALGGFSTEAEGPESLDSLDVLVARSSSLLRLARSALMSTLECREQLGRFNDLYASMEATFDHSESEVRRRFQQNNHLGQIIRDVETSLDELVSERTIESKGEPLRFSQLNTTPAARPTPPRPKTLYLNATVLRDDFSSPSPSTSTPTVPPLPPLPLINFTSEPPTVPPSPSASSTTFSVSSWDSETFSSTLPAETSQPTRSAKQLLASLNQRNPPGPHRPPPAARDLLLRIRATSPAKDKGKGRDKDHDQDTVKNLRHRVSASEASSPASTTAPVSEKPRRPSMPSILNTVWSPPPPVPALPRDKERMDAGGGGRSG